MNAHVIEYYRLLCLAAEARGDAIRQWLYYTWSKLEEDPDWQREQDL